MLVLCEKPRAFIYILNKFLVCPHGHGSESTDAIPYVLRELFSIFAFSHMFSTFRNTRKLRPMYIIFSRFSTARQSSVPLSKVIYQMFWRCGIMNHSYESRVIESLMTGAIPQIHADGGRNVRARLLVQAVHATLD